LPATVRGRLEQAKDLPFLRPQEADPMQGRAQFTDLRAQGFKQALHGFHYLGFINIVQFQRCYTSYQYFQNASFLEEIFWLWKGRMSCQVFLTGIPQRSVTH
jgi:hypothetical protein